MGCGTGYYGLYLANMCKSYHGIDIAPKHIEQFQNKIEEQGLSNLSTSIADATNLFDIADCAFDAVLVFGPMYHLPKKE